MSKLRVHELKCWPEFFDAIERGDKTFEVRRDDRGFCVGDTLWLREWLRVARVVDGQAEGDYTGRDLRRRVTYVLTGFGVERGFVCMGLSAPPRAVAAPRDKET